MILDREMTLLIVLLTAAWALMLIAFIAMALFVAPLRVEGPRWLIVTVGAGKVIAGAAILAAWVYSYLKLRDFFAKIVLQSSPNVPSSRRRRS